MKKIYFILGFFYFTAAMCQSIDNNKAHRRYWFYRTRLINDFMKIGKDQGDCIVFAERNYDYSDGGIINNYNPEYSKVGPDQIDITNQYLSALALEYKILSRNYQSTSETVKEIYYLIRTINRLDARADFFWYTTPSLDEMLGYPENTFLNGFMLREDMPKNYFSPNDPLTRGNFKHFNYSLKEYNSTTTFLDRSYTGLHETNSLTYDNKYSNYVDFYGVNNTLPKSDLSCPHDKYYSMFIAFMMIVKYLPDNLGYYENGQLQYFQDGEWNIKQEVRNITNRCHSYIRGNIFGNQASNWVLEYPNGNNLVAGDAAWPYSYPLAQMICKINSNYPWNVACDSYLDAVSTANASTYSALNIAGGGITEDGGVFQADCQAGSNVPFTIWLTMDITTSAHNLKWANLLRKVLHQNGVLQVDLSEYSSPLASAPCGGPYNFDGSHNGGTDWKSQDRLEHPNSLGNGGGPPGNYPGVDYMLLHNLYYEYLNQKNDQNHNETGAYTYAYNLMDNYDELTWPYSYSTSPGSFNNHSYLYGVNITNFSPNPHGLGFLSTDQGRIKVFQNLTSRAQIYASASPSAPNNTIPSMVEYRAGKDITLLPEDPYTSKPGFEVRAGSDFHAYIQRYVCSNGDYGNGLRTNDSTIHSNDYETDAMNTTVPIHYVDHPLSDSDLYPYGAEEDPGAEVKTNNDNMQNTLVEQYNNANYNGDTKMQNALESEASKQRFVILPNPNNGVFKIFANKIAATEEFTIVIYDMKGLEVTRYDNLKDNVSLDVDFTQLSRGIYLVNISSTLGYKNSKKVSIN